jgi:chloramphenicol O-acetyltransferase type A
MNNFEKRRDRLDFFESFENPLLNLTIQLETPDFISFCKKREIPVFHFFLFCVMKSLNQLDHFKYRLVNGNVVKNEVLNGSYTVLNQDNLFNYTCFNFVDDLGAFVKGSLKAKGISSTTKELLNTSVETDITDPKNYVFITSLPWFDFTSIQHPVYKFKSADVPSLAWGKFTAINDQKIRMPFSIQVHHGFVDGIHIHELACEISKTILNQMKD